MPPARGLVYLLIKEHKMSFINKLLNWLGWRDSDVTHNDLVDHSMGCDINPASGLPMVGGCCGVDVSGNPYGTDFRQDDSWSCTDIGIQDDSFTNCSFGDDSFSDSSGMGCGFDSD